MDFSFLVRKWPPFLLVFRISLNYTNPFSNFPSSVEFNYLQEPPSRFSSAFLKCWLSKLLWSYSSFQAATEIVNNKTAHSLARVARPSQTGGGRASKSASTWTQDFSIFCLNLNFEFEFWHWRLMTVNDGWNLNNEYEFFKLKPVKEKCQRELQKVSQLYWVKHSFKPVSNPKLSFNFEL